jgi:hypothetical protein
LEIESPTDDFEPWLLTGTIVHGAGHVARFERNRVIACSGNWDVELTGQTLTFRRKLGDIVLQLGLAPSELRVERLDLLWPSGVRIAIEASGAITMSNLKHTGRNASAKQIVMRDNTYISTGGISGAMTMVGFGAGINVGNLEFSGNSIAVNAGVADLASMLDVRALLSEDMLACEGAG